MLESWRWFGPSDPIPLNYVRQAGATGIVTALHEIPNGEEWPSAAISERRDLIQNAGLDWVVVESIPVHEDIKCGAPGWERYAHIWAENLSRLAQQGMRNICYNFMPVLDWTRTDLNYPMPDGALALRFEFAAYAAFDLFILKRESAAQDYTPNDLEMAERWLAQSNAAQRDRLTETIVAGLPGSEESYTLDTLRTRIAAYDGMNHAGLRAQLGAFLDIVLPVAEQEGARLSIHPDDPPRDLFGLPRVVSNKDDLAWIASYNTSPANGFTLCVGSLGVRADNDILEIIDSLGERIHFAHLRTVKREADPRDFHEDSHLAGDTDLVAVIRALLDLETRTGTQIPMRPDHGHRILYDLDRESTPGYPAIGRLRGLAELRGAAAVLAGRYVNGT
ncbi:mannonate dehydratase [Ruegeria sp. 2205SS24-7]|uniref:mannonate dehydratase n=1 Tax=Ruegeria discodermiae TaxID=3064389 RepID=UPI002741395A|nr:mannonate dehydratase [Ruegeria sp. 2205SS24-7]MDP5218996.1 mannonate dehydratase [Ruegeria sp. 2205SS24-7]